MKRSLFRAYRRLIDVVAAPAVTEFLLRGEVGRAYGVSIGDKRRLMRHIREITREVQGATSYLENLLIAASVLELPPDVAGDVVECGCFKGRSTATLSRVCEMTGRQLRVYDSFAGLPEVADNDRVHVSEHVARYETYQAGDYTGTLEEVRDHVRRFGVVERCTFTQGYFEQTLGEAAGPISMIFLDVDLFESLKTCLRDLWPLLSEQGVLMSHEAKQLQFVKVFFDDAWWREQVGCEAPGLMGAGVGMPVGISEGCGMGKVVKRAAGHNANADADGEAGAGLTHFCGDPTAAAASA